MTSNGSLSEPPLVEIHLLGPFQVVIGGRPIDQRAWKLRRAHQLIKILALTHGHQLHRDQLTDRLWPDADGDYALASFHQAVHAARHALEPERAARSSESLLPLRQQVLSLAPSADLWIDAEAFTLAATEARSSSNLSRCLAALELYTGELLPEDLYEDWAQSPRDTIHETYLSLIGFTAQLQEANRDFSGAIATLLTLLEIDRINEPAYASLMRLHALSGRRDQADRLFQQLQEALERELDAAPSADVVELLSRINAGEFAPVDIGTMPVSVPSFSPTPVSAAVPARQEHMSLSLAEFAERTELVDRAPELGKIQQAWDAALAGEGQIVLLSGEPGIGKTRLTETLAEYAETQGAAVFWARCHQTDDTPAFWLWSQVIHASLRGASSDQLRADFGSGLAPMAQVVPALVEFVPDIPALPPLDGAQARYRFFASLADYLIRLAERRPIVLLLDDLQWADPSSVLALEFFADHLTGHRILLLGTLRDTEVALPVAITQALERLGRLEATQRIQLGGFDPEYTAKLAESVAGQTLSPEAADSIHTRTDGNPFFVRELVRLLASNRRDELGSASGWLESAVPAGVREAVMLRLQPLAQEVQSVLATAAVIGSSFELPILATVSGIPIDPLLDRLDEAVGAGLVEPDLEDVNRFWFSHILIRDTLQAGMLGARQARLHARIGEVFEERAGTRSQPDYAEIAYHYAEAAPIGKAEEAITYLTRAAEQSMTRLAYAESAARFRQAVNLIKQQSGDRRAELAAIMLARGRAEMAAGETNDANDTLLAVIDLAQELGDPVLQATVAIELVDTANAEYHSHDPATIERIRQALDALPREDSALRAHCLSALARLLNYRRVHYGDDSILQDPLLIAQEAVAMARRVGDPAVLIHATYSSIEARNVYDSVEQTLLDATEMLRLAEIVGDPRVARVGFNARVVALIRLGRTRDVDLDLNAMADLVAEHHLSAFAWSGESKRATRKLMQGSLPEAEYQIELAHRVGRESAPEGAQFSHLIHLFALRREQDRMGEIEEPLMAEIGHRPGLLFLQCLLANLYVETDRSDRAAALAANIAESYARQMQHGNYWLGTTAMLAELYADLGDDSHAAELIDWLLPYRQLCLCPGGAKIYLGPAPHFLGRLSALLGRWDEAESFFDEALRKETEMATPIQQIQTQCAHAAMLAKLPGRIDDANRLLDDAGRIARRLDLPRSKRVVGALQQSIRSDFFPN